MDITKFCAEEDARYPISKPWVKDGWKYATDARIVVRVPTDEPDSKTQMYQIVSLFAARPVAGKPATWAIIPTHDGSGVDWEEPACLGAAPPEKACKQWGKCGVTSEYDQTCTNTIKGRAPGPMHFAGKKWGGYYIDLINKELPGARYTLDAKGWMHFVCGDVEGILPHLNK